MTDTRFAPERDRPIAYTQRTRDWYLALGYGNPYRSPALRVRSRHANRAGYAREQADRVVRSTRRAARQRSATSRPLA